MEVCVVCGAFLVINDTSGRLSAHMEGKQHQGYKKIREAYAEWKEKIENKPMPPPREDIEVGNEKRSEDRKRGDRRDYRRDDRDRRRNYPYREERRRRSRERRE